MPKSLILQWPKESSKTLSNFKSLEKKLEYSYQLHIEQIYFSNKTITDI
jgi:hypothetical protein